MQIAFLGERLTGCFLDDDLKAALEEFIGGIEVICELLKGVVWLGHGWIACGDRVEVSRAGGGGSDSGLRIRIIVRVVWIADIPHLSLSPSALG